MNRHSRLIWVSLLLIPALVFLQGGMLQAQRTIEFFEPDFSIDYATYSILYHQIGDKPPHYDQFRSREAATKGFRRVVKKEIYEGALFTMVLADSAIEVQEYDKQGMLVKQSHKCFRRGELVADSISTLLYKVNSITVSVSALVSGKMTKTVDRIYKIDAEQRITELVVVDRDKVKRSVIRYVYDQQHFLTAGYKKEEQGQEQILFRLSYREWYDNPAIRGGRYEGEEEAKHHPAYLLYKETVNEKPVDIKYVVWHDSVSRISASFALSPALIYFLYDKICEQPVNRSCTERSGFYRWNEQGKLIERSIYERTLRDPAHSVDHAARSYPPVPGWYYYNSANDGIWFSKPVAPAKQSMTRQALYDGILYVYEYFKK